MLKKYLKKPSKKTLDEILKQWATTEAFKQTVTTALAKMFEAVEKTERAVKKIVVGREDFTIICKYVRHDTVTSENTFCVWGASVLCKKGLTKVMLVDEDGKEYFF